VGRGNIYHRHPENTGESTLGRPGVSFGEALHRHHPSFTREAELALGGERTQRNYAETRRRNRPSDTRAEFRRNGAISAFEVRNSGGRWVAICLCRQVRKQKEKGGETRK